MTFDELWGRSTPNSWARVPRGPAAAAVGAFLFGTTSVALTVAGTAITWGTIGGFLITTAVASWALSALAGKQPGTTAQTLGNVREAVGDFDIVYGKVRKGGTITFMETSDRIGYKRFKDDFLHMIIVLAGHEVEEIGDVYFNDEVVTLDSEGFTVGDRWKSRARVKKHLGSPNQLADPDLVAETSVDNNFRGRGIAYLYVRLDWDGDVFPTGVPNITAMVKGRKVYDPRTGTTAWTDNAALCIRDYLEQPFGLNSIQSPSSLGSSDWATAANVCDILVNKKDSSSERRFTLNGVVSTANTPRVNLQNMLTSCGGTLFWGQGKWQFKAGYFPSGPYVSFDADDLRSGVDLVTKNSRKENFNIVTGTFLDKEQDYIEVDYPKIESSVFLERDNNQTNTLDMSLPYTTSSAAAQRLAKMALFRSREEITIAADFGLKAAKVKVGDVIQFTFDRYGFNNKFFEVVSWKPITENGELKINLVLRETSAAAYDWNAEEKDIISNDTTLPDPTSGLTITNLSVTNRQTLQSDGSLLGEVVVAWDEADSAFIDKYVVQWKKSTETVWSATDTDEVSIVIPSIKSGVNYDYRVKAVSFAGFSGPWEQLTTTVDGKETPPGLPTNVQTKNLYRAVQVTWSNPTDRDLNHIEIYTNTSNTTTGATKVGESGGTKFIYDMEPMESRWFFLKAVDHSGNKSGFTTGKKGTALFIEQSDVNINVDELLEDAGLSAVEVLPNLPTSGNYDGRTVYSTDDRQLYIYDSDTGQWKPAVEPFNADDIILERENFPSDLKPIEVLSSLPTTGNYEGRVVLLLGDGKIYRYKSGAFTASVPSTDIQGQLQSSQIAAVAASKVTGQLTNSQIADIAAAKVSGQLSVNQIVDIPTTKLTGQIVEAQITNNAISAIKLANNAVTSVKIANEAVEAAKIAVGAVQTDKIANGAVNTDKIINGAINATKLANSAVTSVKIANNAVEESKIATGAVTGNKISDNAVTETKILDGSISTPKITTNAITSDKIVANAVTTAKIDALAITAGKIATGAIVSDKIQAGAIGADQIAAGAIVASKIAVANLENLFDGFDNQTTSPFEPVGWSGSWGTLQWQGQDSIRIFGGTSGYTMRAFPVNPGDEYHIGFYVAKSTAWDGTTSNSKLRIGDQDNSQKASIFYDSSVPHFTENWEYRSTNFVVPSGMNKMRISLKCDATQGTVGLAAMVMRLRNSGELIVDGAISTNKLSANAVVADKIAANAITTAKVDAGAITAVKIASNAVTADKIQAGSIVSDKIQAGAIGADQIAANAITASKMFLVDTLNKVIDSGYNDLSGYWSLSTNNATVAVASGQNVERYGQSTTLNISNINPGSSGWTNAVNGADFEVDSSKEYFASVKMAASEASRLIIRVAFFNESNSHIGNLSLMTGAVPSGPSTFSRSGSPPAGTKIGRIQIYYDRAFPASFAIGKITVLERNAAELIVDGSISTNKLSANAVTADKIEANAVTTSKIEAGAITTGKIASGAVVADNIAANAITAGKIEAGAVTTAKIDTGAITAVKIASGAVIADKISSNAVTSDKIEANAVTAGKISAGAISADKIQAGAILASKLYVGDTSNAIVEADFSENAVNWRTEGSPASSFEVFDISHSGMGKRMYRIKPKTPGNFYGSFSKPIPVTPNSDYNASVRARCNSSTGILRVSYYDANMNTVGYLNIATGVFNWEIQSKNFTTPSTCYFIEFAFYVKDDIGDSSPYIQIVNPTIRKAASSEMIVDGAITAVKIAANSVNTNHLVANAVTAGIIAAGAVSATAIQSGAVTADKINVNSLSAISANLGTIQVGSANIANGAIDNAKIANGAITNAKIGNLEVDTLKLANGAVTVFDVAGSSKVLDDANGSWKTVCSLSLPTNAVSQALIGNVWFVLSADPSLYNQSFQVQVVLNGDQIALYNDESRLTNTNRQIQLPLSRANVTATTINLVLRMRGSGNPLLGIAQSNMWALAAKR